MSEAFDVFDEIVLVGDLSETQALEELRQMRLNLNALFAFGSEEVEEPEED
jgi:hypothetical protein